MRNSYRCASWSATTASSSSRTTACRRGPCCCWTCGRAGRKRRRPRNSEDTPHGPRPVGLAFLPLRNSLAAGRAAGLRCPDAARSPLFPRAPANQTAGVLVFSGGSMTKLGESVTARPATDGSGAEPPGDRLVRTFNALRDELISTLLFVLGNRDDAQDAA